MHCRDSHSSSLRPTCSSLNITNHCLIQNIASLVSGIDFLIYFVGRLKFSLLFTYFHIPGTGMPVQHLYYQNSDLPSFVHCFTSAQAKLFIPVSEDMMTPKPPRQNGHTWWHISLATACRIFALSFRYVSLRGLYI